MKCLVIDIGNTSTTFGIAENHIITYNSRISRVETTIESVVDILEQISDIRSLDGAIIASVVPELNEPWKVAINSVIGKNPIFVSYHMNLGINIDYPKPERIGADRLVDTVAASRLYGCPAIVADFGTALTFDILSSNNTYIGGVIAPGLPLMTDYLHDKTALLPHVNLAGRTVPPIGKSTEDAIVIGAIVGYRGIVRETVEYIKKSLSTNDVHLAATGGFAGWILSELDMPFIIEPNLTLIGLSLIYEMNS